MESKIYKRALTKSHLHLLEHLHPVDLLDFLFQEEVLAEIQRRDITELKTTTEKNRKILELVQQKGEKNYETFKICLVKSNQAHLKDYLEDKENELIEEAKNSNSIARRTRSCSPPQYSGDTSISFRLHGFSIRGRDYKKQDWQPKLKQVCQLEITETGPVDVCAKGDIVGVVQKECSPYVRKCLRMGMKVTAVVSKVKAVNSEGKGLQIPCHYVFKISSCNAYMREYIEGVKQEIADKNSMGEGPYRFEELVTKDKARRVPGKKKEDAMQQVENADIGPQSKKPKLKIAATVTSDAALDQQTSTGLNDVTNT